jgi:hypothetical protein
MGRAGGHVDHTRQVLAESRQEEAHPVRELEALEVGADAEVAAEE